LVVSINVDMDVICMESGKEYGILTFNFLW